MAAKKKEKEGLIPTDDVPSGIVPITDEDMDILGDTTGAPTSDLDGLSIYRQGKGDEFKCGDDKVKQVTGIFLYSQRPMRAFWPIDSEMDGSAPCCWSLNSEAPAEGSEDRQNDSCSTCQWNELGSAKVGRGKACKTKASDFIIQVGPFETSPDKIGSLNKVYVTPQNVVGPALMNYSISNAVAPDSFRSFVKGARELGRPVQGVLAKWTLEEHRTKKSNVEYSACEIEIIGVLPDHKEDPELWGTILKEVRQLKEGQAVNLLTRLAGSNDND